MKTIYPILILFLFPFMIFAQIPNYSFENWSNHGNYDNPDQWSTLNSVTAAMGQFTCEMGMPGNPGNYYMKLTSRTISGLGNVPGIAVCGALDPVSHKPVSGFPFTDRPASFKGKWQYMAYGEDQGYISVLLTHWNGGSHLRDTIAWIDQALKGMQMSWESFNLEFNYTNYLTSAVPDTAWLFCSASNAHGAPTANYSYLWLDSLAFYGYIGGFRTINPAHPISIYYDKIQERVNIHLNQPGTDGILAECFNLNGESVEKLSLSQSQSSFFLELHNCPPGIYIISITTNKGILNERFVKH